MNMEVSDSWEGRSDEGVGALHAAERSPRLCPPGGLIAAAAFVMLAAGCLPAGSEDNTSQTGTTGTTGTTGATGATETQISDLYLAPSIQTWPNDQVFVCFNSRATSTEAAWYKTALANAWQAVTPLAFSYSNSCPYPGQTNYIKIDWTLDPGWGVGGLTGTPVGMRAPQTINLHYCTAADCLPGGANAVDYQEAFQQVSVHETGHALGWLHEQQRPDYVSLDCPLDNGTDGNNVTVPGGTYLTVSYDTDSIMNYCRGWDGSNPLQYQAGYHAADRISPGDAFGVQQIYGKRFAYWLYPTVQGYY